MISQHHGFTLSEILISLLLASLIFVALIHQFLSVKAHYTHVHRLIEEDIELQLVIELISDSIRRAGFTPCSNLNHLKTANRCKNDEPLNAFEVIDQSKNELHLKRMSENFMQIDSFMESNVLLVHGSGFSKGERVLIADCFHAEVLEITDVKKSREQYLLTLNQPVRFAYENPVYIGQWLEESYYIRQNKNRPSLFYKLNHSEELTQCVKSVSFQVNEVKNPVIEVLLKLNNDSTKRIKAMVRS